MPVTTVATPVAKPVVMPVKAKVSKEDQVHLDARDARVKAVQAAIDAAKLIRDAAEKLGTMETPGAKLDRVAKETEDLKKAGVLNKIELLGLPVTNDLVINSIAVKLDEVIAFLNK